MRPKNKHLDIIIYTLTAEKYPRRKAEDPLGIGSHITYLMESGGSVLVSLFVNCPRFFPQYVPNAHDQPMDGPFS
jgi:hypothetical protein